MKFARDFRYSARQALAGKWFLAVAVGLIASLLGGTSSDTPKFTFNFNPGTPDSAAHNFALSDFFGYGAHIWAIITSALLFVSTIIIVFCIVYFILSSFIGVGYARFNLDLIDGKDANVNSLFAYFSYWKTTALSELLRTVYVFLWSLLFFIPGIIASYRYSMTSYILAENPNITASEAIERSKDLMACNKWRLFCLHFSFIGWDILACLTFGIGYLWLTPYKQAAQAAFYREISSTITY